jgi:hypothetical protein
VSRRLVPGLALLALVASGCGGYVAHASPKAQHVALRCPSAWVAGWRALAKRVAAPVFCPTWLPQPLTGQVRGEYSTQPYVAKDRSYLVSFLWFEKSQEAPYEVHVNLRGWPGRTSIPMCQDTLTAGGETVRPNVPCFADAHGQVRVGNLTATVYTANQGIDTWHVLYAWRYHGSLYTLSQHVAPPFTYERVRRSLDRMLRGLVVVRP